MNELILHHYPQSPFAEKARLMLGVKGLSWHSVLIPPVMPKPDLTALTGGYRRTPVLQIGADIYCDTALIARRLEREKAVPALFPEGQEAVAAALAQFGDQVLFQNSIAINFQPHALEARFTGLPQEVVKGFVADRKALFDNGSASRPEPDVALAQWPVLMSRLEMQLDRNGEYLLGDEPSIADLAWYHPLWFMAANAAVSILLDDYPNIRAWMARINDFGAGAPVKMSAEEAIRIARDATPEELPEHGFVSTRGFTLGEEVTVQAVDYGCDPVAGRLVHEELDEIVIAREDERAGLVHVHFPRLGYRVDAA
ncbi:glutathione S-transferase family protein [Pseudomonas sp. MYb185]|uniref:glutathione S-transferase family protein n=1 Tax=Pseudomonas sp. MYb185 TaxID=1848729 RepID=UPI000CFDC37E|nr:glutathione S-transferase family protein [Pseudomonas sp. MYb185]PRB80236.1 glutathione S-transferase [Pseudomonas sp. MYb185]